MGGLGFRLWYGRHVQVCAKKGMVWTVFGVEVIFPQQKFESSTL